MALIERFTPGGNIYPDGSSTFALLVDMFQRVAENRDAVDAEIVDRAASAVLEPLASEDVVFAVVDEEDRRTWLEVAPDGGPTAHAAGKLAPVVAEPVAAAVGVSDMDTEGTGLSFVVVDEGGRRTDLELDEGGHVTERVLSAWRGRLGLGSTPLDNRVVCSGDSQTGGVGGASYPTLLANNPGWTVVNEGVGGETSVTIAGRLGGRPMLVTFPGGEIPAAKTAATVVLTSDVALTGGGVGATDPQPLKQQWQGFQPVTIAGVVGTMSRNSTTGVYTFTRSDAGAAVPINYPTPMFPASSTNYRGSIHVMWWGHNDDATVNNVLDPVDIIARQQATIGTLAGANPRYLVVGVATRTGAWRRPGDLEFTRAFGRRFINLGEYLSSYAAFEDAGVTPTTEDDAAITAGEIPPSFRIDNIHFTPAGYELVARQVENRIREMGWLD